ncbi:hypothetical protein HYQ46_009621 [Verticillium longisporum]|nr:hypothetical protein HYQ46_009621 [Verticillium longisporum]
MLLRIARRPVSTLPVGRGTKEREHTSNRTADSKQSVNFPACKTETLVPYSEAMMRIAIAGAGWLSSLLTLHISQTGNPVLILSRSARPDFEVDFDCQVAVVDYDDATAIQFALQGVDLVISTFRGPAQINLIHAARRAGTNDR